MDDLKGRKTLIDVTGIKEGRILDIGMGDCGCMSFFLAKRGFDVVGIDRSPNAVHDSREDAKKRKFQGRFEARLANAEDLPFEDNEFNAVSAYHSMHHMDDLNKAISEMYRYPRLYRRGPFKSQTSFVLCLPSLACLCIFVLSPH